MSRGGLLRRLLLVPTLALVLGVGVVVTASTAVPASRADERTQAITANGVKPTACASITVTNVVSGSGTVNGGSQADLVLGSAGADTIRGMNGNDCILGGAGNDSLRGDNGTDVCIGGGGTDTFNSTCETQIQ